MEDEDPTRKKEPSFWENVAHWAKILESLIYVANAATQMYHVYREEENKKSASALDPPVDGVDFESLNLTGEDVQAREGTPTCAVCMDNTIQTIIRPCNHAVLCFGCARHYQLLAEAQRFCPLCKEPMRSIEKVFFG